MKKTLKSSINHVVKPETKLSMTNSDYPSFGYLILFLSIKVATPMKIRYKFTVPQAFKKNYLPYLTFNKLSPLKLLVIIN